VDLDLKVTLVLKGMVPEMGEINIVSDGYGINAIRLRSPENTSVRHHN
jgi:hypothetical protein